MKLNRVELLLVWVFLVWLEPIKRRCVKELKMGMSAMCCAGLGWVELGCAVLPRPCCLGEHADQALLTCRVVHRWEGRQGLQSHMAAASRITSSQSEVGSSGKQDSAKEPRKEVPAKLPVVDQNSTGQQQVRALCQCVA